ncbi:hypothetical protein [Enterobacter hormaechei]|uniref:hypothetical protein n=1 Tax=Enterobacter hormaechei TaxID=158836 RepID=UPI001F356373|nr:hypothetical protein [Enterobacter hormaechei]
MSTTLKEWLKHTIAELEEERDATPGAVNEDAAMALEAMKWALASLMADPVAWTDEQELRDVEKYGCGYLFTANPITPNADPHRVIKLYTASPEPMLPEEMPKGLAGQIVSLLAHNIGDKLLAQKIWNACRAAMLQGAENVESRCTIQAAPALDSSPKNAESRCGKTPVILEGLIAAVNRLLDSDGSRGCYSANRCYNAHEEVERLLAAAPQHEVKKCT